MERVMVVILGIPVILLIIAVIRDKRRVTFTEMREAAEAVVNKVEQFSWIEKKDGYQKKEAAMSLLDMILTEDLGFRASINLKSTLIEDAVRRITNGFRIQERTESSE